MRHSLRGVITVAVFATMVAMTVAAQVAEHVVKQKGKKFVPDHVTANVGDRLVFVNDDQFSHNVYSDTPGFEFSIRKQGPGETDSVVLEKAGEFTVHCIIHPRMMLTVTVE